MFLAIRHECGYLARLVGQTLTVGWNLYCCDRCGDAFFKLISREMIEQERFEDPYSLDEVESWPNSTDEKPCVDG